MATKIILNFIITVILTVTNTCMSKTITFPLHMYTSVKLLNKIIYQNKTKMVRLGLFSSIVIAETLLTVAGIIIFKRGKWKEVKI